MVADAFGLPLPFKEADVTVNADTALVTAVGAAGMIKVCKDPNDKPAEFDAIAQ